MRLLRILAGLLLLTFTACYYDVEEELYPTTECQTEGMSYSEDIVPILEANCYQCHDQATNTANVTLEGHSNLLTYVNDGRLLGSIRHEAGFSPMPKNAPQLLDCEIEKIEAWISQGTPNN